MYACHKVPPLLFFPTTCGWESLFPHFKEEVTDSEKWCPGPMAYKQQSQDCAPDSVSWSLALQHSAIQPRFPAPRSSVPFVRAFSLRQAQPPRLLTLIGRGATALTASKASEDETSDWSKQSDMCTQGTLGFWKVTHSHPIWKVPFQGLTLSPSSLPPPMTLLPVSP